MLIKCDPAQYEKYVIYEGGQKVLYVELVMALYGTLCAVLIFWCHLTHKLIEWGFEINPYDWCAMNKQIKGSHCTLTWQIDDLKLSHISPHVLEELLEQLKSRVQSCGSTGDQQGSHPLLPWYDP